MLKKIFLLSILLMIFVTTSFAQIIAPRYTSSEHKFSFSYDGAFTGKDVSSPTQLVLLKVESLLYPEFEIQLIDASSGEENLSAQEFADQQTTELARNGIVDVKEIATKRYTIAGKEIWLTELRYPVADKVLLAAIAVIPGKDKYSYRLIYRDIVASYFKHKPLRNQIFDTFQFASVTTPVIPPTMTAIPSESPIESKSPGEYLLVYALIGFALVLIVFWYKLKRA
jgi:hypothetical protein